MRTILIPVYILFNPSAGEVAPYLPKAHIYSEPPGEKAREPIGFIKPQNQGSPTMKVTGYPKQVL